jgi:hypothetical protein
VAVIFATQSLSDLSRSGIADVIFESCPSKILLPNPQAQTEALSGLYQAIGLNRRQIQIVSNAVPLEFQRVTASPDKPVSLPFGTPLASASSHTRPATDAGGGGGNPVRGLLGQAQSHRPAFLRKAWHAL